MRAAAVYLLVAGALLSIGSVGFHLNDEADQATAAHNLYRGHFRIEEVPADYYQLDWSQWAPRGGALPTETRASAVAAAPFYVALLAWSAFAPVQLLLVILATGALVGGVALWRAPAWRALNPRRARIERIALGVGGGLFGVSNALAVAPIADAWLVPLAMQLTSIALTALAVVALRELVAKRATPLAGDIAAGIFALSTAVTFWGFGQKYHATQAAAVCGVMWLRYLPGHTRYHHALAYAVAGLAFWVQPRQGLLLLGSLGLVEIALALPTLHAWRAHASRAALFAALFALGVAPYAIENTLTFGAPHVTYHNAVITAPAAAGGEISPGNGPTYAAAPVANTAGGLVATSLFADASAAPRALYAAWIHPGLVTHDVQVQFGVLMLAPLLALAPLAVRRWSDWAGFVVALFVATILMYGLRAAAPGGGSFDSRYLTLLHAPLAALAAIVLARRLEGVPRPIRRAIVPAALVLSFVALVAMFAHAGDYTTQFHTLRRIGLASLVIVAAWALVGPLLARTAWGPLAAAPVAALALVPAVLFAIQYVVHHPPRAMGDAGATHFLPLAAQIAAVLDALLGA